MKPYPVTLAIDPGTTRSAWVLHNPHTDGIVAFGLDANPELLAMLRIGMEPDITLAVIEQVESFGMPVGRDVFETVYWSGRFAEALHPLPVERIGRKAVKLNLCGTARAKDPNVRAALLDRYGGAGAIGKKATPGPLYGIAGDVWAALAVACTWADQAPPAPVADPPVPGQLELLG